MNVFNTNLSATDSCGLPHKVNFHLWKPCNERCPYCFATYDDDEALRKVRGGLREEECKKILDLLRPCGVGDINFAGGEPTLCPWIGSVIEHARKIGFTVSITTNGAKLRELLDRFAQCLTAVAISVDSANENTQKELGRGHGRYVEQSLQLFVLLHKLRIHSKLNTVVTSLNWREDMNAFVLRARPEHWKILQVLRVAGQNDEHIDSLGITSKQYEVFVSRHRHLESHGIRIVPETNDLMTGSYAMIDPIGRFFSNVSGAYTYSSPILEVGVETAFREVEFRESKFIERGGIYRWPTIRGR